MPLVTLGQVVSGSLEGTVKDENGQVVPGVTITVTATATNQTREIVTDANGSFRMEQLPIGSYKVKVSKSGFKQVLTDTEIRLGSPVTVDPVLAVGSVAETVTVEASNAGVELSSSEVSRNVSSQTIDDLPVLSRNPAELLRSFSLAYRRYPRTKTARLRLAASEHEARPITSMGQATISTSRAEPERR